MSTKTELAGTPLGNEIDRLKEINRDLLIAGQKLLDRIDNMTSDEFECGKEQKEREMLRIAIAKALGESS